MRASIAQRNQIGGWGFSLVLHALLLSMIWPVLHHAPDPVHQEPFQWEVTLVELPQQTTSVDSANDSSSAREFFQTTKIEAASLVPPPTDVSSSPDQAKKAGYHIVEESSAPRPLSDTAIPTSMTQPQPEVSSPLPSSREATATAQETSLDEGPKADITAPVRDESSVRPMTPIVREFPSIPESSAADAAMTSAQIQHSSLMPTLPAPSPADSGQPLVAQTDYGWLQQAVSHRLEELKRSSRPFLEDSSRLKVLVRAVVSDTGDLMEADVFKSSGLERIDREAVTLVQRAFPMQLDHALDRPRIVMRIPITYSRD